MATTGATLGFIVSELLAGMYVDITLCKTVMSGQNRHPHPVGLSEW